MNCARITTEEQLKQAQYVRNEVFVKEQQVDPELEWDEYDASPAACRHYLATDEDGTPIGASRWKEYEPGIAKLQRIAVLKPYRGRSVGRLLVEAMEEGARREGYSGAVLDAQCSAEAFYHKLGYKTLSPDIFLDAGIPHVRMGKNWEI
ncbi:GNAT family N-acetyltransferase [Cohnella thailandensis]|uniref:GNAT family N-acetyltransferase n=1 Tax=Cohnella thailandensis TaxID=557557 RepID=A0A841T7U9_9BACL|nr:GNAT family N-acetyltransferase [Cohnella thailandensis]MBB6638328.1 GNAT family N-acetyltransferase [Cohnella thailandensis]MBP1977194.1 putative GNAT family N-acyltransferase [Cohnella thailandensis]